MSKDTFFLRFDLINLRGVRISLECAGIRQQVESTLPLSCIVRFLPFIAQWSNEDV